MRMNPQIRLQDVALTLVEARLGFVAIAACGGHVTLEMGTPERGECITVPYFRKTLFLGDAVDFINIGIPDGAARYHA